MQQQLIQRADNAMAGLPAKGKGKMKEMNQQANHLQQHAFMAAIATGAGGSANGTAGKMLNQRVEQAQQKAVNQAVGNATGGLVKNVPPGVSNAIIGHAKKNPNDAVKLLIWPGNRGLVFLACRLFYLQCG